MLISVDFFSGFTGMIVIPITIIITGVKVNVNRLHLLPSRRSPRVRLRFSVEAERVLEVFRLLRHLLVSWARPEVQDEVRSSRRSLRRAAVLHVVCARWRGSAASQDVDDPRDGVRRGASPPAASGRSVESEEEADEFGLL